MDILAEPSRTLTARAGSYRQPGRTGEAITIQEKVVAGSVRLLGQEHPDAGTGVAGLRRGEGEA
ncbi:tetratricopeptide repeat protein [Micromonospora inaquosa]|uniref:Uncharacterized protein n=1 Tax=Micromonospora inaquosa TaxID=2203716 RepID=A0A3N9X6F5_9ACTN|nr:tetratricopeptide repeat protein [Micromonospora inaquosa]RQX08479.1 hypothetical protein DLJ59_01650 [Micromonospora inaquosa]